MKIGVLGGNGYLGGRISSYLNKFFDTSSITRNIFEHPNCENITVDYNSHTFISTLKNFDTTLSRSCGLRKPDDILPQILKKTQKQIDNVFKGLTTKVSVPAGRINKDCILLRVMN